MPPEERTVSAVVVIRPAEQRTAGGPQPEAGQAAASALQSLGFNVTQGEEPVAETPPTDDEVLFFDRVKAFFTRSGFEVHAPIGMTFSIGGHLSHFEDMFGQRVIVDDDALFSPVEVEGGGRELSLERLPEGIRAVVESITFPEPPPLPGAN